MNFVYRASTVLALLAATSTTVGAASPEYRLPENIEPVSQTIELTIDPSSTEFSGTSSIRLAVGSRANRIGINQVGLDLSHIVLSSQD